MKTEASLVFCAKKGSTDCLEGCYVGVAHSIELVLKLQETLGSKVIEKCLVWPIEGCKVLFSPERRNNLKEFIESESVPWRNWFSMIQPWGKTDGCEVSFSSEKSYEYFSPAIDRGKCLSPSEAEPSNNDGSEQPANETPRSWNRISIRELGSCDMRDFNDGFHTQKRGLSSIDVYTLVALNREDRSGIGVCKYGAEVYQ
ncbi:hypothetical protein Ancab_017056 [Ancistrocladus abbreviatus]